MKYIKDYILEALKINSKSKVNKINYNYYPKDFRELKQLIEKLLKERGNNADLNDIDISKITNLSYLFNGVNTVYFNGDISKWNVSNVENMYNMFASSYFNGDISEWDVSNVKDMGYMFIWAKKFNKDISNWNVSKDTNMKNMFLHSPLEKNPPKWYNEKS